MNTDFDVAILAAAQPGSAQRAHLRQADVRRSCSRRALASAGARGRSRLAGTGSISAAAGCTRPIATPGRTSLKRAVRLSIVGRLWGAQHHNLGFSPSEQNAAKAAFAAWLQRLSETPPPSDCAADALQPGCEWNGYIQAIISFVSGAPLESVSVADYLAYDEAATDSTGACRRGTAA